MRHLIALICAALACGCASQGTGGDDARAPEDCRMGRAASLKLEPGPDGYVTTIGVNFHPARMSVDTGADRTIVAGASSKRLGLPGFTFNTETLQGVGGFRGASVVLVNDVQLGEGHARRLTMLSMPAWGGGDGLDGSLGIDFLEPFDIDVDVAGGQLGLYKVVSGCHTPSSAMTGALYGVALEQDWNADTHVPLVPVTLGGARFTAMLDTGSFHTSMYSNAAARAGLRAATATGGLSVRDIGGHDVDARLVFAPSLDIGDLTVRQMPIVVLDENRHGPADILLGRDFFERVHVWISHSSRTVIMQYPPVATPQPPA